MLFWVWLPPPCFSPRSFSPRKRGSAPWVGYREARRAPWWVEVTGWCDGGNCANASATSLADAIGRAGINPSGQTQRGRPFGEQGSTLCGQSRVQGRDPPGF